MADMIESFLTASPKALQEASPSSLSMHQRTIRNTLQGLRQAKEAAEKKVALLERRIEQMERKPPESPRQEKTAVVPDAVEERLERLERDVAYIMKAVNALEERRSLPSVEEAPLDPEKLLSEVASRLGVSLKAIMSRSREDRTVLARKIFTILARGAFPWISLKEVGRILGRDHSSVLSGIRTLVKNPHHFEQAVSIGESLGIPGARLIAIRKHYLEEQK